MTLTLTVSPADDLLDVPRHITVTGARPGTLVTLEATTVRAGQPWSAQATYRVTPDGSIDLDRDPPAFGDYGRVDGMALLTSQQRESASGRSSTGPGIAALVTEPLVTAVRAWSEHEPHLRASATLTQRFLCAGVTRQEVRTPAADAFPGLVGTLFVPAGRGPHPTIMVLNGSGGGINEERAALYASRGIQALALGYFRAPGLPDHITGTPLEYFAAGLRWMHAQLAPRNGVVVVSGQSRGGELALLLGSLFPDLVGAVVGFVPGAHVHGSQGAADPEQGWDSPTWTLAGEPLDHLWDANPGVSWQPWTGGEPPHRHRNVYVDGLRDREFAARSRIAIEQFPGPVACVSGMDDRLWPSSMYSRQVMDTLREAGHTQEQLHLDYPDAGHAIGLPQLPVPQGLTTHPVSGITYTTGGTPAGNSLANADSFAQICRFVQRCTQHAPQPQPHQP
ncbi:acyl-CoA thioester hydrolase/BAAT C-terminal domain-containing protein [Parenemella sanctibonifatiensis]|uniref:Palmitoyl-CoA hydrolase n=1 Tax=Parenemella sanctibonifatiensis TaxID=2016505 RepID=A0A255EL55_9ACTN|nr:acyl-CoA thioesterase/bile acid-CoA:amino acid N-acyltransferase family protein [Parenemella sanctibonifatiensis]OYN92256.1 palmitoyl-CoA hydrolase [Parenemella sanctibonifatiensis]